MADQRPCKLSFESSPLAESTHRSSAVWASRKGRDIGPPAPNDNAHRQTSFLETSCPETTCQTKTRCTPPSPPSSRAAWPLSFVVSPSSRVWTTRRLRLLRDAETILASRRPRSEKKVSARGYNKADTNRPPVGHHWCTTNRGRSSSCLFCVCVCVLFVRHQASNPSESSINIWFT